MRNKEGYTPREEAISLVTLWISNMVKGRTNDVEDIEGSFGFKREVLGHLVKLHNKLLATTKLDYIELHEPVLVKHVSTTIVQPILPRDD